MSKAKSKTNKVYDLEAVIKDIALGDSVVKACKHNKVPTSFFYSVIDENEEIKNKYARAREDRGDACLDKISSYQEQLIAKEIDPQTARVLIDTEKWKAAKFYPKMYGDKVEQNISGTVNLLPAVKINGKELKFDVG